MSSGMTTAGTCFGFEVHSTLDFSYLRGGSGTPLTVEVGQRHPPPSPEVPALLHWTPPQAPLDARLYGNEDRYHLWIEGSGWFSVDQAQGRITMPAHDDPIRREERLWGIPSVLSFAGRGDVPLHAAAVEIGGRAVVLAAPGRFGKTTFAAGLAEAGHRILAEDLTCIRLGEQPAVIPGPAMLRLRVDVADRFAMSWGAVLAEHDGRVHVALDPRSRGTCHPVPVAAVVLLRWGHEPAHLQPHSVVDALSDLWGLSFHLPTTDGRLRCFDGLTALADRIPVFNLWRRPTFDDMRSAVDLVAGLCAGDSIRGGTKR